MNPHILKQVETYLILRLIDTQLDAEANLAYVRALELVDDAHCQMQDAFEIEWEKMKA